MLRVESVPGRDHLESWFCPHGLGDARPRGEGRRRVSQLTQAPWWECWNRAWFKEQNGEFDLDVIELEVPVRSHIEMFSGKQKAWRC